MAKILGKTHNRYVLGTDTHSLTLIANAKQRKRLVEYRLNMVLEVLITKEYLIIL